MKFYETGEGILLEPKDSRLTYLFEIPTGNIKGKYWNGDPRLEGLREAGLLKEIPEEKAIAEAKVVYNNLSVLYGKALAIAKEFHAGQVDKAGADYFTAHVLPVSKTVSALFPDNGLLPIVALLHDILEDTTYAERDLVQNFPPEVVDAVVAMTHKKGETYNEYIERVAQNDLARRVKVCDLIQNMDLRRIPDAPSEKDKTRVKKYTEALVKVMNSFIN